MDDDDSVGASDLARRLRRDAKSRGLGSRYWAGWKIQLSFGPMAKGFGEEHATMALEVAARILGEPPESVTPEKLSELANLDRDVWHLSVSWRGGFPAESGKQRLKVLVASLGVPEDKREGFQAAEVFRPGGAQSPQVTHWVWREVST